MLDQYTPEEVRDIFAYLRERDAEMKKAQRGA